VGDARVKSGQITSALTRALGELLSLARAGKLHGLAYSSVIEDKDGDLASGSNAVWNGDPAIQRALHEAAKALVARIEPAKRSVLIDMAGNALESTTLN
jgi:hypothetical protein